MIINFNKIDRIIGNYLFYSPAFAVENTKSTDFSSKEKVKLEKINDMTTERGNHAMTLLSDGRVLITGGTAYNKNQKSSSIGNNTINLKSAEIFNPESNSFTKISDMNLSHARHASILLKNKKVLILDDNQCEIFDPKTNKFELAGKLKVNRGKITALLMADANILIVDGGKPEIEIYNPKTNETKVINKFKFNRNGGCFVQLSGNKILATGGYQFTYDSKGIAKTDMIETSEIYDYSKNEVKNASNIITPQKAATRDLPDVKGYDGQAMVLLKNNKVLITGGFETAYGTTKDSWLYSTK